MTTMNVPLIPIWNSKWVRIPKSLIKLYNLESEVTITASKKGIIITSKLKPRQNWKELFAKCVSKNHLVENEFDFQENYFDKEDWKW
jgi:antitoxin MazE